MSDPLDPIRQPDGVINADPADSPAQRAATAGPVEGDAAGRGADPDTVQDDDLEERR